MLLLIDAGNTRIKWALLAPDAPLGGWLASGAVTHAELDTLAAQWAPLSITDALLSNVAGVAIALRLRSMLPLPVRDFVSLPWLAGVTNGYRNPAQLGCDRFAAAIGAHALAPGQAVIVANCGTATTIDAVTADGVFLGGMILPGLGLMASSLARNTAQLPQIAGRPARHACARRARWRPSARPGSRSGWRRPYCRRSARRAPTVRRRRPPAAVAPCRAPALPPSCAGRAGSYRRRNGRRR